MKISTSGVGSGVDIRTLVDNLLEAESKEKIKKFDMDEASTLAKITAFGTLKSAMSDFADKLEQLQTTNQFDLRFATAEQNNNVDVISVTADATASPGKYTVEVTQLALAQKMGSINFTDASAVVGTGQLKFAVGTNNYTFNINASNQTLQGIHDTINMSSKSTGITASLITTDAGTSIVFSSPTGTNNTFTVTVANDADSNNTDNAGLSRLASNNLTSLQTAQNAIVKIEGVPVTSDSNTIDNAINGVTIDLLHTNTNSPIILSVNLDLQSAQAAIQGFVDSYNAVFNSIKNLSKYDINGEDTGILIGDATLRSIEFQMRRIITDMNTSQPAGYFTLSQIGITSDRYTGMLVIDQNQLTTSLNDNFDAVGSLFMDSTNGLVTKMDTMLENYIEINGILQSKTDGLNESIAVIDERRVNLERHLKSLEQRLLTQFIAMDTIVAKLRSLSEYLETQLEKLPKPMMFRE
ncbi:MAG: hypothetical protein BGO43_11170 [Gammaproteobacteria bacterium 39-13]|nr:flagellar filament capping protein FliD [Gammaproteobacteria bacterium]OJV86598.1 MAG: hypothetical protein BGO43_11170 [Gammaproteobacteria bacterium 39-13]